MRYNITLFADDEIADMLESHIKEHRQSFTVGHRASSYSDCLEPSIKNKAAAFIIQAKPPIICVDDLLFDLQGSGRPAIYILFQVCEPGKIRYAATTMSTNPLVSAVNEIFTEALDGAYALEQVTLRTTLLSDEDVHDAQTAGRRECLMEILRGCSQQEFLTNRDRFGFDLKETGYYLFFWELMGFEFADHETNKYIYNFSGELLRQECCDIIRQYNGGEVFYCTPNLLCIIINGLDVKSEANNIALFEELLRKLVNCTGNRIAFRYVSGRVAEVRDLRFAYEKYHTEKSLAFFLRDASVIRPQEIELRRRSIDMGDLNTLLHEITDLVRYDLMNPALETSLHKLFFDLLKPSMSFTLYYSSTAIFYNALAEVKSSVYDIMPIVNNSPNLLQFSSIEEQYDLALERLKELQSQISGLKRTNSSIVLKAINYMENNYTRDITITDISSALFISNVYLSQIFKREMGMGVIKYLINYRIEQAKKLLRETDEFVYTVAEKVGFHEYRHFSRTFKEITGFSPTQYKKQGIV